MTQIHETAVVSKTANLAENVVVGPYSIIESDVSIGTGTVIDSHVVIKGKTCLLYTSPSPRD